MPTAFAFAAGRLIVLQQQPERPVIILDAASGKVLARLGEWGMTEDGFVGPWHVDPIEHASAAWIWDLTRHRLVRLELGRWAGSSRPRLGRPITVRADAALTSPQWVDSTLYSPGFFHTGRLATFNARGAFVKFLGATPVNPARPNEPTIATQQAHHSDLRWNPTQRRFALAEHYSSRIQILRPDGAVETEAQVPEVFDARYDVTSRAGEVHILKDGSSRWGYMDLAVDDRFIFALFSGAREENVGRYTESRELHVFDWKGQLVARFSIEAPAAAIALDANERRIFIAYITPHTRLVVHSLELLYR